MPDTNSAATETRFAVRPMAIPTDGYKVVKLLDDGREECWASYLGVSKATNIARGLNAR